MENVGKLLVGFAIVLLAIGLVLWLFADRLSWLGNLPGDIRVERPGFSLYVPITTMLLLSLGLSLLLWLIGRFTR